MTHAKIPSASLLENIAYNLIHVVPYYLQGIFTRNRFWVFFWGKLHPDPLAVKFIKRLRKKYQSRYLYLYMLRTKSLLVLDEEGIKRVLDRSPQIYAEPTLKRRGMSHFQPHALTISRGREWQDRRRFNEAVLSPSGGHGPHPCAHAFLGIIQQTVADWQKRSREKQKWQDFADLFEKITLPIVLGKNVNDTTITADLKAMMRESNRVFALKKSKHFDPFYKKIRNILRYPPESGLAARCRQVESTPATRPENQIPHWLFAMKDTLAENTVRALALIVAHPEVEKRVREEIAQADLNSPQSLQGLPYLEGCLQEAMRLWPTTPLLVRETTVADILGGAVVPPETQVLIANNFNHRDDETHSFANTFSPELWLDNKVNYHFNHFSNGPQICAGKDLALTIAKSVLARLISSYRYTLIKPRLDPKKPLPQTYNYYRVVFTRHHD